MTQQVDPRSSAVHDQTSSRFEFQDHGSGSGGYTSNTASNNNNNNNGNERSSSLGERWPSLLNARQVLVAFILETMSRSRPLQEKLNIVFRRAWHHYLFYVRTYPLLTTFLSCLVALSAVPLLIFAAVTGTSLGLLVGVAAVVVLFIQSIVVTIAGGILLLVLGFIVFLTVFTFFWLIVGYFTFQFVSHAYVSYEDQRLRQLREERERELREQNEDVHEWEREDTPATGGPTTHEKEN
ncbi:hypothetical protein FBU30_004779 [Linnemannia zychae]|nr:hypothetical protein FBU30_004779 [Linnemannia zychae]